MPNALHDTRDAGYAEPLPRSDWHQLVGVVGGPLVLLFALQAKYVVAQRWSCTSAAGLTVSHLVSLVMLLLALGATMIAYRQWQGVGREAPGDLDGTEGRTRVMAAVGVGVSGISALVLLAMWLPLLFLDPCLR